MINSRAVYTPPSRAATAGMPQGREDEIEMIGVQAGHETTDIFERPAKCQSLNKRQNVALTRGHNMRVLSYNLCVQPGDSRRTIRVEDVDASRAFGACS